MVESDEKTALEEVRALREVLVELIEQLGGKRHMVESEEWEVNLSVVRRPSERSKGLITDNQFHDWFLELQAWALKQGFSVTGLPKTKRTNCPTCGRIIRSLTAKRCPMCSAPLAARLPER